VSHRSTSQPAEPPGPTAGRRQLLALLGLGIAALGACGKKGPLRLPEPAAPEAGPPDEETE
jgi:predicted small lipoprotein YifL